QSRVHIYREKRYQRRIVSKQLSIDNDVSSIPAQYLMLLESVIFHATYTSDSTLSELENEFEQWAGFNKIPEFRKKFHYHCCRIWAKINHAYNLQVEAQKNPLELHVIPE
ncbi:2112_t:CDS:1, partial [Cetraspora pellucida]